MGPLPSGSFLAFDPPLGPVGADAGLIRAGNPQLRAVLIELGQRLVHRTDGRWFALAVKLRRTGKKTNVVVAAVVNRWVRSLYHQMQPEALLA